MTLRITYSNEEQRGEPQYVFDREYLRKMEKFHKQVNEHESILGVYISSTKMDKQAMIIVQYFLECFQDKTFFRSPLKTASPIVMLFDPLLQKNKLEIKVLNVHSLYFR